MPKRIQRRRTKGWRMPAGAVYVGRPSKWGNPFFHTQRYYGVDEALALYRDVAEGIWNPTLVAHHANPRIPYDDSVWWRKRLGEHPLEAMERELRGKDLACWCPLVDKDGNRVPCHADVLLELANAAEKMAEVS